MVPRCSQLVCWVWLCAQDCPRCVPKVFSQLVCLINLYIGIVRACLVCRPGRLLPCTACRPAVRSALCAGNRRLVHFGVVHLYSPCYPCSSLSLRCCLSPCTSSALSCFSPSPSIPVCCLLPCTSAPGSLSSPSSLLHAPELHMDSGCRSRKCVAEEPKG